MNSRAIGFQLLEMEIDQRGGGLVASVFGCGAALVGGGEYHEIHVWGDPDDGEPHGVRAGVREDAAFCPRAFERHPAVGER